MERIKEGLDGWSRGRSFFSARFFGERNRSMRFQRESATPAWDEPDVRAFLLQPFSQEDQPAFEIVFHLGQAEPGIHTLRVLNHGVQLHEVVVVKLAPGATASEFAAAAEPRTSTPPPGAPIGGVVGIERGGDAFFTAQFDPGRYGLICFFPDRATGAPHFTKGMTLDFTVR